MMVIRHTVTTQQCGKNYVLWINAAAKLPPYVDLGQHWLLTSGFMPIQLYREPTRQLTSQGQITPTDISATAWYTVTARCPLYLSWFHRYQPRISHWFLSAERNALHGLDGDATLTLDKEKDLYIKLAAFDAMPFQGQKSSMLLCNLEFTPGLPENKKTIPGAETSSKLTNHPTTSTGERQWMRRWDTQYNPLHELAQPKYMNTMWGVPLRYNPLWTGTITHTHHHPPWVREAKHAHTHLESARQHTHTHLESARQHMRSAPSHKPLIETNPRDYSD